MITVELEEGERQMVLLALAKLSIERPGWDTALNAIAMKMDNVKIGPLATRATMYDEFRSLHGGTR